MAFQIVPAGHTMWGGSRDAEGHRTYWIRYRVASSSRLDGPALALQTPGLPFPGSIWAFGNDVDPWAWCRPDAQMQAVNDDPDNRHFDITLQFSSKPLPPNQQRCNETEISDPLLEPPKISWTDQKYQEEATFDRFGLPIVSSSWERLKGPQLEFDKNRLQIRIEQNVSSALQGYQLPALYKNHVNDRPLWGLPRRTIKLSGSPGSRLFNGSCSVYYNRTLEFDVMYDTFDRLALDEGTKFLNGHWNRTTGAWVLDNVNDSAPLTGVPSHFIRATDPRGNPIHAVLNGAGLPAGADIDLQNVLEYRYYVSRRLFNQGHDIEDTTWWSPIVGPSNVYESQVVYEAGNVVMVVDLTGNLPRWRAYIALSQGVLGLENKNRFPPDNPTYWEFLGTHDVPRLPVVGLWNNTTEYDLGDTAEDPGLQTVAGSIFIQKYPEANFLLLGIPTNF